MLARALIEQGKLDDATFEWRKILLLDANDHVANFGLGMLAWQNRDFQEAEAKLTTVQSCGCPNLELYRGALVTLSEAKEAEGYAKRLATEADKENKKIIDDMLSDAWLLLIPKIGWVKAGIVVTKGAWKAFWKWFKPNPEVAALEQRLARLGKQQEESWKIFLTSPL